MAIEKMEDLIPLYPDEMLEDLQYRFENGDYEEPVEVQPAESVPSPAPDFELAPDLLGTIQREIRLGQDQHAAQRALEQMQAEYEVAEGPARQQLAARIDQMAPRIEFVGTDDAALQAKLAENSRLQEDAVLEYRRLLDERGPARSKDHPEGSLRTADAAAEIERLQIAEVYLKQEAEARAVDSYTRNIWETEAKAELLENYRLADEAAIEAAGDDLFRQVAEREHASVRPEDRPDWPERLEALSAAAQASFHDDIDRALRGEKPAAADSPSADDQIAAHARRLGLDPETFEPLNNGSKV